MLCVFLFSLFCVFVVYHLHCSLKLLLMFTSRKRDRPILVFL
jgi:hypothetical protein